MEADLYQQVVAEVGEVLEVDVSHLTPQSRVAEAIEGMDSMRLFELILDLEDRFDVTFDEDTAKGIETVQDLVTSIEASLAAKAEAT